jgi:hypothetical protein
VRYGGNPACVEARESTSDEPLHRERIAMHRTRCADCRAHSSREEEIQRSLLLLTERALDDLSRARIQARLAGDFDRIASERARGKRVPRSLIAAAIAAALVLLWLWPREAIEPIVEPPRLRPFLVAGPSGEELSPSDAIEAGEGMIVRAELDRGDVTLIGPGRAVIGPDSLLLERGLLLVHVDRPFEVRAGDVSVRVLGTRFAVDHRERVRVSVSEGTVEVRQQGAIVRLERGQAWPDGEAEPRLSSVQLEPPRDPSGVVVIGGSPPGAIAILDGVALGPTPLIARLSAGAHRLEVQADLHRPHRRSIEIPESGVIDVSFTLDAIPREAPKKRSKPKPAETVEPVQAEEVTAESLYQSAEEALAAERSEEAERLLEELTARFAEDPLAESALYELARIDHRNGALERAHARLIRLLEKRQDAAFAESGQRLLCQIDVETRRYDDANACWRSFRERFPESVHDAEALASLIGLAQVWNDCARVKVLAEEFRARHAEHALRSDVEARLERCDD